MRRIFDNLTVRLVSLVLLAVAPCLGVVILTAFEQKRLNQADTESDLVRRVRGIAAHHETIISEVSALLAAVTEIPFVREADPRRCADFFDGLLVRFPACTAFALVSPEGRALFSTQPYPEDASFVERPWFKSVTARRSFYVGEYEVGRFSGKPTLPAACPAVDKKGDVGLVVYAPLDIARINKLDTTEHLYPDEVLGFLDRKGTLLSRTPEIPEDRRLKASQTEIVRIVLEKGEGAAVAVGIDGIRRMFAFTQLGRNTPYGYVYSGIPVDRVFEAANRILLINLIALFAVALCACAAAVAFGRILIVRPVNDLLATTERLASGDFSARTGRAHDKGEIGRLAQGLDAMAAALQRNRESLEQVVHERTAQIEAANEELRSFSYSVSHDLRTPLRIIEGFSRRLLKKHEQSLDNNGQDCVRRIVDGCRRMSDIIDDLLNLSRVTAAELKSERVDISGLAAEIADELRRSDPNRKVEFIIHPGLTARGDLGLIRAALMNLMGNAWKFTGKKPVAQIVVGGEDSKDGRALYVKDNGAGFHSSQAHRLFTAFERLHPEEEFPGTGIGLAIVKRIIHRHGGRVWAEGEVSQGAVFYFTLSPDDDPVGNPAPPDPGKA
jgi:signal transduction histidine kinase